MADVLGGLARGAFIAVCVGSWLVSFGVFASRAVDFGLLARRFFRWRAELDESPVEVTTTVVLLPAVAAVSAIFAGIGVNIYTSEEDLGQSLLGVAVMAAGLLFAMVGCLQLLRLVNRAGSSTRRIRRFLVESSQRARSTAPPLHADELAERIGRARRIVRLGERWEDRGQRLTFPQWSRTARTHRRVTISLRAALVAEAAILVLAAYVLARDPASWPGIALAVYLDVGAVVATVLAVRLPYWSATRSCRIVGAELAGKARATLALLERRVPAERPGRFRRALTEILRA